MASRVILSLCLRNLSLKSSAILVPTQYSSRVSNFARVQGIKPLFAQNYSKEAEEVPSEVDPNAEPVIDEKDASKLRTRIIPVETSIKYMKSNGYATTYGTEPIWVKYKRNFKGQFAPPTTRKTCIRSDKISTGNPCPICRDEYLVLEYRNTELLKQFISPFNGEILPAKKTGLCQRRHNELLVAITKAKDYGLITFDVPFRSYDYSDYHKVK